MTLWDSLKSLLSRWTSRARGYSAASVDSIDISLHAHIEQMLDDYRLLPAPEAGGSGIRPEIAETFRRVKERDPATWNWSDAYSLERAWVELIPLERLRIRVVRARDEYKEVAADGAYAKYEASKPPEPRTASASELRADLAELLVELQRIYTVRPQLESRRNSLSLRMMLFTLSPIVLGILALAVFVWMNHVTFVRSKPESYTGTPLILLVALTGALGGFMSVQQRIHAMPMDGNPAMSLFALARGWSSVYLSPLSGAVFAVALYLMFAGGLLQGELFPEFYAPPSQTGHEGMDFAYFADFTGPKGGKDHAMVIVWAFVAGFAERFVPDTLSRLTQAAAEAKKGG